MDKPSPAYPKMVMALVIFPPLILFMVVPLLLLFWVTGASAFSGREESFLYNLGAYALIFYLGFYCIFVVAQTLVAWQKWPLAGLFHTLAWLCFVGCGGIVLYVLISLGAF